MRWLAGFGSLALVEATVLLSWAGGARGESDCYDGGSRDSGANDDPQRAGSCTSDVTTAPAGCRGPRMWSRCVVRRSGACIRRIRTLRIHRLRTQCSDAASAQSREKSPRQVRRDSYAGSAARKPGAQHG